MKKKYLTYIIAGLFIITAILILLGRSNVLTPDSAYHLKTGEWILKNKTIPKTDIYSWHPEKLTFIAHEWLYQVIIALIHKMGGMIGLTLFSVILTLSSYLVAMWKNKAYILGGIIAFLMVVCNMGKQIMLLPDSFGVLLLLIILLVTISEKLKEQTKLICVFCLSILMANIHGGMLSVAITLLIFLCTIKCIKEKQFCQDRFSLIIAAFIGGIINPYGISIYRYIGVIGTQSAKYNTDYITYQFSGMLEVFLFVGIQALIIIGYMKKYKGQLVLTDDICLYVAVLIMFLTYQRMVNLYTYGLLAFGLPYGVIAIEDINEKIKKGGIITVGVISLFFLIIMGLRLPIYNGTADEYIRQNLLSDEILEELRKDDVVLYNNVSSGGYLIYENIPVFMDGRTETYTHEYGNHDYWLESVNIDSSPEYVKELGYNFTHMLLRKGSYEAKIYSASKDWKIKSSTDDFILYIKN